MSLRELDIAELLFVSGGEGGEGGGGDSGGYGSDGANGYGSDASGAGDDGVNAPAPTVSVDEQGNVSVTCPSGYDVQGSLDLNTGQMTNLSCVESGAA